MASSGLNSDFQMRLNQLVAASGGRITFKSGYRDVAKQTQLWNAALKKYGSVAAARKWVAPPGHSNHEQGLAMDLGGDLALAHKLAPQFGLVFPLSNEAWHVEPTYARGFASKEAYTSNAGLGPSSQLQQIAAAARKAGFSGDALRTAVAVAMAESKGDPGAVGDIKLQNAQWGPSVGAWQVRSLNKDRGRGTDRDQVANMDLSNNARSAFQISGGGVNWSPWSTFKSGAYKAYLDTADRAISGMGTDPVSGTDNHDLGGQLESFKNMLNGTTPPPSATGAGDPTDVGSQLDVLKNMLGAAA